MNKKILVSALVLTILAGLGSLGISSAYAEEFNRPLTPMIQNLIEKFNLNEEEVTQFFQEQRDQNLTKRKAFLGERPAMGDRPSMGERLSLEERLNAAVSEGKMTEEQKTAYLEKMEERKQIMEQAREDFETWAEESGINFSELNLGPHGFRTGSHFRMGL